jgi:hypothetical protein
MDRQYPLAVIGRVDAEAGDAARCPVAEEHRHERVIFAAARAVPNQHHRQRLVRFGRSVEHCRHTLRVRAQEREPFHRQAVDDGAATITLIKRQLAVVTKDQCKLFGRERHAVARSAGRTPATSVCRAPRLGP